MQQENILEGLLRLQLSSDAISALYLPSVLSTLSSIHFSTSTDSQIHKWATRITSLLQSKDASARWAGACLAKKTAELRSELAVEYAQRWINLTLPLLSKAEPPPVWKASIDLLTFLFVTTTHLPEFRRQLSTPTVPKFSAALLELLDKGDVLLKHHILISLAKLVSRLPSLHRALTSQILSSVLQILAGSFPPLYQEDTAQIAAHLLATLHQTDGKVGAPLAWRNTLESAMFESWKCIGQLQGTIDLKLSFTPKKPFELPQIPKDPLPAIQISLQRLYNMIFVMDALFRVNPSRPVLIPVADLSNLTLHLLQSTDASIEPNQDVTRLQLEMQVVPRLVEAGCNLTVILATSLHSNLTPHATSLISCFAYHLEQGCSPSQCMHLLLALKVLLDHTTSHTSTIPSRLFRALVPFLSPLLPEKRAIDNNQSRTQSKEQQGDRKSKGKNRAKALEGEEVLNGSKASKLSRPDEIKVILHALDVLQRVLQMSYLPSSLHSIGTRMILGLHAHLLVHPPVLPIDSPTSNGSTPISQLISKLIELQHELLLGTAGYASRGVPLTIAMLGQSDEDVLMMNAKRDSLRALDSVIHPRMPPPMRHLPHAESIMLWRKEEGKEEKDESMRLGLVGDKEDLDVQDEEVGMAVGGPDTKMDIHIPHTSGALQPMEVEHDSSPQLPLQEQLPKTIVPTLPNTGTTEMQPSIPFGTFGTNLQAFSAEKAPSDALGGPIPSYVQPTPPMPIVVVESSKSVVEPRESQRTIMVGDENDSDEDIPSIDMGSDSE